MTTTKHPKITFDESRHPGEVYVTDPSITKSDQFRSRTNIYHRDGISNSDVSVQAKAIVSAITVKTPIRHEKPFEVRVKVPVGTDTGMLLKAILLELE